ncbi:MAG: DNA primase [Mariprofundales bacterium]
MARFEQVFLDQLQMRSDIVEIISRYVTLRKAGNNFVGLCPFHHEKTPSFSVSADKQLFYCFGCGKGGSIFQFLMDQQGMHFAEAVAMLAEQVGMPLPQTESDDDSSQRQQLQALMQKCTRLYCQLLYDYKGESARLYLQQRGLPEKLWQQYQLGLAPASYNFLRLSLHADTHTMRLLEKAGMLFSNQRGDFGDRFRSRLMFPIHNRGGHIVAFGGRTLVDDPAKYLNSPETPLFHKSDILYGLFAHRELIRKQETLLVVEGYMDVLALAAHELPIAIAPLGTAIGDSQLKQIFRLCAQPVFCFDGDKAGIRAAWRALEIILPVLHADLKPRFMFLAHGEDPDSLLQAQGKTGFLQIMQQAVPALEMVLREVREHSGDAHQRAALAQKAQQWLSRMSDHFLRQSWQEEIERLVRMRLPANVDRKLAYNNASHEQDMSQNAPQSEPQDALLEQCMMALLQQPSRFAMLPDIVRDILADNASTATLYNRTSGLLMKNADNDINAVDHTLAQLAQEFPQDQRISRWLIHEKAMSNNEFSGLLLTLQARNIRSQLKQDGISFADAIALKQRLLQIDEQRRVYGQDDQDGNDY